MIEHHVDGMAIGDLCNRHVGKRIPVEISDSGPAGVEEIGEHQEFWLVQESGPGPTHSDYHQVVVRALDARHSRRARRPHV